MKTTLLTALAVGITALAAPAAFEKWTNSEGAAAELELVQVLEQDGEKAGEFRMRNGQTVVLKASQLSAESAARLDTAKPTETANPATTDGGAAEGGGESVFHAALDGNLVSLDGKSVKRHTPEVKPAKYYIFYYSAAWCGPCQAYTPQLVKFYNDNKNANFEIVFVSSDRDRKSMVAYMREKSMPWPALDFSRVERFRKRFDHGVSGIPAVIVCELDGTVVGNIRDTGRLAELVK